MALHTYIGARYVPRFMGTYDATQIYEALDVVDNGSGTSYIARDIVPAGTPLTDTDHWFVYGASSGAIVALQNDMINAQNDILNLQGDVTSLDNRLDYLEGRNRRFVTISDSYGEYPSVAGSWQSLLALRYPDSDFFNYYKGSMGIAHPGNDSYIALTLLQAHSGDITDHDTITDIIFGLGINDYSEALADVETAYDNLITYCKTEYPKARVWFAFMSFNGAMSRPQVSIYKQLIGLMQSKASEYGCKFCANMEYIMHNVKLKVDATHPNADGAEEITNALCAILEGGTYNAVFSIQTKARFTGETDGDIVMSINNNMATIGILTELGTSATLNFSGRNPLSVGTMDDTLFSGGREGALIPNLSNDASASDVVQLVTNNLGWYLISSKPGSHPQNGASINNCVAIYNTLDM